MSTSRKKKRASSRAHTEYPHCGKKLHGEKGLKAHIKGQHQ